MLGTLNRQLLFVIDFSSTEIVVQVGNIGPACHFRSRDRYFGFTT